MADNLHSLKERLLKLLPRAERRETDIPGLAHSRFDADTPARQCFYVPMIALVVQGYKRAMIGGREASYGKGQVAVIGVDVPGVYREGMMYYGKTHRHPNSTFRYTTSSLLDLMKWDAMDNIDLINVPLLLIAGGKADSRYMSEEAFQKATGTKDKELFLIPDATHIQTYYVPKYVNAATAKLEDFFGKILK